MDDEKWKKAVDKTEEVVFGYCALRENRKARKASRKARYRSLKQQKGRVRALLHMVGEGIIFGIVYGIFWLIAGVMALRLKWLGERRENDMIPGRITDDANRKIGDSNDCTVEFRTGTVRV